jgi:hypothetical protein
VSAGRVGSTLSAFLGVLATTPAVVAEEAVFRKVAGSDIRKLFVGREFSDAVHWAERYRSDGSLHGSGSGRRYAKRWAVRDGQLCVTGDEGADCREVWRAGEKVELRRWRDDDVPKAGILRPIKR